MSYRFDNQNFIGIYTSNRLGNFILKVRELRDDLWEWEISCGRAVEKKLPLGRALSFPMMGTEYSRYDCVGKAAILFELDPEIRPAEFHDGAIRMSVYFEWIKFGDPCVFYGLSTPKLLDGGKGALGIKRVERWGELTDGDSEPADSGD